MHIDQRKWMSAVAIMTVAAVCGCGQIFSSRRASDTDPLAHIPDVTMGDTAPHPVRPVMYDEREDYPLYHCATSP